MRRYSCKGFADVPRITASGLARILANSDQSSLAGARIQRVWVVRGGKRYERFAVRLKGGAVIVSTKEWREFWDGSPRVFTRCTLRGLEGLTKDKESDGRKE